MAYGYNTVAMSADRRPFQALAVIAVSAALAVLCHRAGLHAAVRFPARPGDALSGPALESAIARAFARLAADPDDLRSRVELAVLYTHKGGPFAVDAINELERARELGASDPSLPFYLGVLYQGQGLYPFAVREYQRFLRNRPEHRDAQLLLAKILYQTGRYGEAVTRYRKLRESHPRDPLILENLGLSLLGARELGSAREAFEALRDFESDKGRRAWYYLGNTYLQAGNHKAALQSYARALPPGSAEVTGLMPAQVHAGMALACEGMGRADLALRYWQRVLSSDPASLEARARLLDLRTRIALRRGESPARPARAATASTAL